MQKFADFAKERQFDGDKIPIADVLNKEIVVRDFRVASSKVKQGTDYVSIQIEMDGKPRVIFTGSNVLVRQLEEYKDYLPFETIIRKVRDFYTFT